MQIAQDSATAPSSLEVGVAESATPARGAYADYKVIRRNGAVVGFEPSKISVAMTKAFLAVAPDEEVGGDLEAFDFLEVRMRARVEAVGEEPLDRVAAILARRQADRVQND